MFAKIVSGGQTGADRAALDVAAKYGIARGGWVPKGRWAEDGRIPDSYEGLVETSTDDPAERTACNVRDSDATLIVSHGPLTGGSAFTKSEAERQGKPVLHVELGTIELARAVVEVRQWLNTIRPRVLNVAGPRASQDSDIYEAVATVLRSILENV